MTYNNNKMSKSSFCYLCGKPIKFDNEYINERTGKKMPLDKDTNEPHNFAVRSLRQEQQQSQQQQPSQQQESQERRYHQCNKGCGQEIYFDASNKSQSGK
jgi:hypothetical protein